MSQWSDVLLPTTMVGSYPRPRWFRQQLHGRDVLDAFKDFEHHEAFMDATRSVLRDQELAGLDVLTDGQMWFDDLHAGIGAFFWYWFERIGGFGGAMVEHRGLSRAEGRDVFVMEEVGSVQLRGPIEPGPLRMAYLYSMAQASTPFPVKAGVGAGPVQLSGLTQFVEGPIHDRYELSVALADLFNAELIDLQEAGCTYIQYEDLGAWTPNLTGPDDFAWVRETVNRVMSGVHVHKAWHFCLGNAWGNRLEALVKGGYAAVLPHYYDVDVDELVLDFACREMADVMLLSDVPEHLRVGIGVIDVRNLEIEHPEHVAIRIRRILEHIAPERVTLTTDCGMKQLPRPVAMGKLRALVQGARIVRQELTGTTEPREPATLQSRGSPGRIESSGRWSSP